MGSLIVKLLLTSVTELEKSVTARAVSVPALKHLWRENKCHLKFLVEKLRTSIRECLFYVSVLTTLEYRNIGTRPSCRLRAARKNNNKGQERNSDHEGPAAYTFLPVSKWRARWKGSPCVLVTAKQ
jgi:hypothetical protein